MGSRAKELEALWERNKAKRKEALRKDASPKLLQSLPPQLRNPVKVHGLARPKGLRGRVLVNYLISLAIFWQDKRFDDCINALLQHGIVKPFTFEFTGKPWPAVVRHNEYYLAKCLAEVRAQVERCGSERQACREVAAEWAWPGNSLNAAAQQLRGLYRISKK
jgi:hypothetical protein